MYPRARRARTAGAEAGPAHRARGAPPPARRRRPRRGRRSRARRRTRARGPRPTRGAPRRPRGRARRPRRAPGTRRRRRGGTGARRTWRRRGSRARAGRGRAWAGIFESSTRLQRGRSSPNRPTRLRRDAARAFRSSVGIARLAVRFRRGDGRRDVEALEVLEGRADARVFEAARARRREGPGAHDVDEAVGAAVADEPARTSNLQASAVRRELDESHRFVQESAESTST